MKHFVVQFVTAFFVCLAFVLMCGMVGGAPKPEEPLIGDEHVLLCHTDWLRFYRVKITEVDAAKRERKVWSRWYLIDDRQAEDKEEIRSTLEFYRSNHIETQYLALPGKLPE